MKLSLPIQKQIFIGINEISDLELQIQAWLKGGYPTYISSYAEMFNSLVGDMCFESFVDQDAHDSGYKDAMVTELRRLKNLLLNYNDTGKTDRQIIEDPEWIKVVIQAKLVMQFFFTSNPLNAYSAYDLIGDVKKNR